MLSVTQSLLNLIGNQNPLACCLFELYLILLSEKPLPQLGLVFHPFEHSWTDDQTGLDQSKKTKETFCFLGVECYCYTACITVPIFLIMFSNLCTVFQTSWMETICLTNEPLVLVQQMPFMLSPSGISHWTDHLFFELCFKHWRSLHYKLIQRVPVCPMSFSVVFFFFWGGWSVFLNEDFSFFLNIYIYLQTSLDTNDTK